MARNPKGEVSIEGVDGWLRLRWRHQGKRRVMALGLRDDPINRMVANQRAAQIRLDILSGHFDETLEKYQGDRTPQQGKDLGAVVLFERFTERKSHQVQHRTLEKYRGLVTWLRDFFGDRPATEGDAPRFLAWLGENLEPITARERLVLLKAAWRWGVDQGWVTGNPWEGHVIRKPPKQKPKAFTKAEVEAILRGFAESRYYRHYVDYVRFKFGTGEVNALRWRHFDDDCSVVWVGESHTHGEFKDTKTGKAREVKLSASLGAMLRSRLADSQGEGDDLVFPAPRGGPMDEHNFKRAWAKVLGQVGVRYIRPYDTRHTFISHALAGGMNPVEVAAITGHDVKTLYENYAGLIQSHPTTPDLF